MNKIILFTLMLTSSLGSFAQKTIGKIHILDPELENLLDPQAKIEVLAEGFDWSEGPVWNKNGAYLLFSDVPQNTIYKWKENEGLTVFLKPSGYTGVGEYSLEPGSNGLIFNTDGELVACEHGDRRLTKMSLDATAGKTPLADNWKGKKLNSPNDVVQTSNGVYYFTDPPYGLPDRENSKLREIDHFGVYMIKPGQAAELVIEDLSRPNGVALSPDEKTLYVAQSDPKNAKIFSYTITDNGTLNNKKVVYDATAMVKEGMVGLPDGLKTDKNGNIFTTGPGGILVLNPEGKLLGRIETGQATSNLNWGDDGSSLYITADMFLCRLKTKTIGKGF
ncbi:SMP-30/gluconolactonase/LRE family protein [Jiulongibacter sp. NS-SX5]|uniref:SMP-30/gluconolactonase/LRE family protein n=1 Tax=Jiulongibacter sp. NS-SX5 TaxID=3463854 RepID=UPI00405929D8